MFSRLFRVLLVLPLALLAAPTADPRAPFLVCYDHRVRGPELALYRTVVLAHNASIESPESLKTAGTTVLGYLSLGELAREDAGHPAAQNLPRLAENTSWGSVIPDLTDPRWADWIMEVAAPRVVARGWDGFFLDTLDSARLPAGLSEAAYAKREAAIADLIRRLRARHPGLRLIANRGFASLEQAPEAVDGVLAESVLAVPSGPNRHTRRDTAESAALRTRLDAWKARGKTVYALDYWDPADSDGAAKLFAELSAAGYEALVATPDLMARSALAPLRHLPARALVVYGNHIGDGLIEHPSDSITAQGLRIALERRGYLLEYVNCHESGPPDLETPDLVVFETFTARSAADLRILAERAATRLRSGRKTIFLGELSGWTAEATAWATLSAAAGWSGQGTMTAPGAAPTLALGEPALLRGECPAPPPAYETLHDLVAPSGARVLLRQATPTRTFDSAFVTPFGGVLLSPWVQMTDPLGHTRTRTDPFAFVELVFGPPADPVFDTTTRTGSRLFFAHVDGDGLHGQSRIRIGQRAGEIMRDEVFKKYPLPFTASVITGEIRDLASTKHDPGEVRRRHEIARSIFALPNIEIASHSHSHPFWWSADSITARNYERQRIPFRREFAAAMTYREETLGSVDYIQKNLTTPAKPCRLFLWTGNCLPPAEAIHLLDRFRIPNLNGLATFATRETPYLAAIRGYALRYQGATQVGAPFENDNVYFDLEQDGLEGGFARVIEAFELTGAPRRLLPVNAYWHFYSADTTERLRALHTVLDWATSRPLHPIHAAEYACMMRDLDQGERRLDCRGGHLIAMPPGCTTLRYDATRFLDLDRSLGLLGYRHELGATYVHTDGSAIVRLVTVPRDDGRPRLVYSTRPVHILRTPSAWQVTFEGFSTGRARFEGFSPGAPVETAAGTLHIDTAGTIELDATPGRTLRLPTGLGTRYRAAPPAG